MKSNEIILYGLGNYKEIINNIISDLNVNEDCFDIRLILTEALTNAFTHGNNKNMDKPIYLRYTNDCTSITFEIEDSGPGFENVIIQDKTLDENLLNDGGRGLFLIKCVADKVEIKNKTLIIQKKLIS